MAFEARRAYKRALLRNLFLDFLIMLFAFYKIEFDKDYSSQCSNNDLSYKIGSFEIPFTKSLLENKVFYIKTEQKPAIFNKNEGLKLIINGKEYI